MGKACITFLCWIFWTSLQNYQTPDITGLKYPPFAAFAECTLSRWGCSLFRGECRIAHDLVKTGSTFCLELQFTWIWHWLKDVIQLKLIAGKSPCSRSLVMTKATGTSWQSADVVSGSQGSLVTPKGLPYRQLENLIILSIWINLFRSYF